MLLLQVVYLFVLAMIFALIEIEAEGKYGWAEKMPTWYRTKGIAATIYGIVMNGKPLTGYHAYMFFLPLLVFHMPFVSGVEWTLAAEFKTFAIYFLWAPLWDFLWFVMNPAYGVAKFRKENVWWHQNSIWVLGLFPLDYLVGWFAGGSFAYVACLISDSMFPLLEYGLISGGLLALTVITIIASPLYHRWRRSMDSSDDRESAPITHPREIFGDEK